MGREAEKRGLPKQLPVMASLVESGVKNLNYGDADSVGFFQMRVGIWNQGAYKGFPEKPELQVKWFLDQAEAVKKQRIARGQSVTDPKQFGEWIADVERPAEQYRGRYAVRLGEANGLLGQRAGPRPPRGRRAGRGRRSAVPRRPPTPRRQPPAGWRRRRPEGARRAQGGAEVHRHRLQVGRLDPADGLRLLGARAVGLRKAGVQIPRVTDAQFAAGNGKKVEPRRAGGRATSSSSASRATSTTSGSRWAATSSCTRRRRATWSRSRA